MVTSDWSNSLMATTTPNFGWPVPTSTDLVKDGATAIEGLGDAIDASLLDLKGGTSGQVLAKNSNTDMDFIWVAQDDSNAIQNAIVDAKGDLIAATAADTPARLAVGTNGQVLTADSTAATGLKWATAGGGGKVLQVVSATYSTSTLIASTSFTDTGLSLAITPSSATSKVLVLINQSEGISRGSDSAYAYMQLVRGATNIYTATQSNGVYVGSGSNSAQLYLSTALHYLDSPATTSSTTYKTQLRVETTANSGQVYAQANSEVSTIILLEIGA
jgi:hypothetical protein